MLCRGDGDLAAVQDLGARLGDEREITRKKMFFLPERAEPPAEIHELPVESRQLIGALR